jgi:type IV secretion system protein TrbL
LQGVKIFGNLFGAAVSAGLWLDLANAIALIFAAACILLSFIVITCQFIITQVQIFLSLGMGYFFLAFGGSKFTTPYVERYFALSIGIGIRMMTLYLLVGGGWFITNTWANRASQIGLTAAGIQQAWIIAAVSIIYGFVCWYVPSFIGAMMSGSPTLSHTDMLAFTAPVAMGAIAMMTGGSGVAAAVTSAGSGGGGVLAGGNTPPSSPPSGGTPSSSPVSSPTGGSGGAGASTGVSVAAGVMRGAGTVASRMPSSGSAGSTPHFSGFGH